MERNTVSHRIPASLGARVLRLGCLAALLAPVLLAQVAVAQQAPQSIDPNPPAAAQPVPAPRGVFESIGRWFDQGAANFRSHMLGAKESFDEFNQRAATTSKNIGETAYSVSKNAADATVGAVTKLPLTRVVQGRERCMLAPNGAPDCLAAAETLCRKQGYTTGKSMDFTSAENCPVRTMLGGKESDAECSTVTFISRAMCQ